MIAVFLGLVVDFFIGDPHSWPHPVIAIGKLINSLEQVLYKGKYRKVLGGVLVILNLLIISGIILGLRYVLSFNRYLLLVFDVYCIFSAMAYRSLMDAGKVVYDELLKKNIVGARKKIAMFVSRDTQSLSYEQIIKTLIETLSENFVDGIVSPLLFCLFGQLVFGQGVLFIWIYKGINTMDSMIAYKNDKYFDFGFVAAKVDDLANWIPARISGILLLISGGLLHMNVRRGYTILKKDHDKSASPNAGYPESAVAGLLGIQLGGAYSYFGELEKKPTIGEVEEDVELKHVRQTQYLVALTYLLLVIIVFSTMVFTVLDI